VRRRRDQGGGEHARCNTWHQDLLPDRVSLHAFSRACPGVVPLRPSNRVARGIMTRRDPIAACCDFFI
jgi:hypothetical protein